MVSRRKALMFVASTSCLLLLTSGARAADATSRADVCWESEISSLEEAVGERGLAQHCETVRYQLQYEGETYAEYLRDYYNLRRIIGWELAAGLAPLGVVGAIALGVAWYRADKGQSEDDDDGAGPANMSLLGMVLYPVGVTVCTVGALAALAGGIVLIRMGTVRMERVERFRAGKSSAGARSLRLSVVPHVDPSGAGGLTLTLAF